jgi:hypothetical protein
VTAREAPGECPSPSPVHLLRVKVSLGSAVLSNRVWILSFHSVFFAPRSKTDDGEGGGPPVGPHLSALFFP